MIGRITTLLLICIICFGSCKSKKTATTHRKKPKTERVVKVRPHIKEKETKVEVPEVVNVPVNIPYSQRVANYINEFKDIAKEEMLQYGIPASITLAQGILESGAGVGELTLKANNHFGIKCHTGWEGDRVYHDDDERQECFRKYNDPKYSFRDHSLFLTERKRYASLFELEADDYKAWARGLREAGYATDRRYPDKLIDIIERYQLYKYDAEVLGHDVIAYEDSTGLPQTHVVKKGETLYAISKKYNLTVDQLKYLNNMTDATLSIGQILYVSPLNTN